MELGVVRERSMRGLRGMLDMEYESLVVEKVGAKDAVGMKHWVRWGLGWMRW